MSIWFLVLLQFSVIACAVVAGVFLTFSDFVMRSLNNAQTPAGIQVMQIINREVWRTIFMTLLLSMCVLAPLLVIYACFFVAGPAAALIIVGGVTYLIGMLAVTRVFNIPMNDQLEAREFNSADAADYWGKEYFPRWTFWNHVRAIASAGASACFLAANLWLTQAMSGIS